MSRMQSTWSWMKHLRVNVAKHKLDFCKNNFNQVSAMLDGIASEASHPDGKQKWEHLYYEVLIWQHATSQAHLDYENAMESEDALYGPLPA